MLFDAIETPPADFAALYIGSIECHQILCIYARYRVL